MILSKTERVFSSSLLYYQHWKSDFIHHFITFFFSQFYLLFRLYVKGIAPSCQESNGKGGVGMVEISRLHEEWKSMPDTLQWNVQSNGASRWIFFHYHIIMLQSNLLIIMNPYCSRHIPHFNNNNSCPDCTKPKWSENKICSVSRVVPL